MGGRIGGLLNFPFYFVRLAVTVFIMLLVGVSLPTIRSSNALEVGVAKLLPIGFVAIIAEIFWQAVVVTK